MLVRSRIVMLVRSTQVRRSPSVVSAPIRVQRLVAIATLTVVLAGLAACAGPGGVQRSAPAPTLQLVSSTPLKLPATCEVGGSVAIEFVVLLDGQTADVK